MKTTVINIRDAPRGYESDPRYVYIGRGSRWGNPYSHLERSSARWKVKNRDEACDKHAEWFDRHTELPQHLPELVGKILVCHCKPARCHGDYLAERANQLPQKETPMKIACIGSRTLNPEQLEICRKLGTWFAQQGHEIHTGNADGADQAFAAGANQIDPRLVHLWLPWPGFNPDAIVPGNQVQALTELPSPVQTWILEVAEKHHPVWNRITQGAQKLHARNVLIVRGQVPALQEGKRPHVDLVVAWPSSAPGGGGTGQGMRIAQSEGIRLIDLSRCSTTDLRQLCEETRDPR